MPFWLGMYTCGYQSAPRPPQRARSQVGSVARSLSVVGTNDLSSMMSGNSAAGTVPAATFAGMTRLPDGSVVLPPTSSSSTSSPMT